MNYIINVSCLLPVVTLSGILEYLKVLVFKSESTYIEKKMLTLFHLNDLGPVLLVQPQLPQSWLH